MADLTKAATEKVKKLLGLVLEHHQQDAAIIAEINELLGGGIGIGEKLKQLYTAFDELWGHRYAKGEPGHYVWNFRADAPNAKRLLQLLGLEEVQRRAASYLKDDDDYLRKAKHPFLLFVRNVNNYAHEAPSTAFELAPDEGEVEGCTHEPRCLTDMQHTVRRRRAAS